MANHEHPGMCLRLLVEQSANAGQINFKPMAPVKTENNSIYFLPVLVPVDGNSISLTLKNCKCSGTTVAHVQIIGKHHTTTQRPETLIDEGRVFLKTQNDPIEKVVSMQRLVPFKKLTFLFKVYDVKPTSPRGASLHLNKARLRNDELCDVKLLVDGVGLVAHRAVLAARSPVLRDLLTGKCQEVDSVQVVGHSRAAVDKFLEYLYTDQVLQWDGTELELMQLADEFAVPRLRDECCVRLWGCGPRRALELLHRVADNHLDVVGSPLRRRLTSIVVENLDQVVHTAQWDEFSAANPLLVDVMLASVDRESRPSNVVWSL